MSAHHFLRQCLLFTGTFMLISVALAQDSQLAWQSVTSEQLLSPKDSDWINYRRTYDAAGYSPL